MQPTSANTWLPGSTGLIGELCILPADEEVMQYALTVTQVPYFVRLHTRQQQQWWIELMSLLATSEVSSCVPVARSLAPSHIFSNMKSCLYPSRCVAALQLEHCHCWHLHV
eukprot:GHRR01033743.1.p2 GENE.GHRR01033743.1~~GHRR01033743.1.p2  ORF type:complete len:111 (-),score=29.26 GHRR01033743.1:951-1283(-)